VRHTHFIGIAVLLVLAATSSSSAYGQAGRVKRDPKIVTVPVVPVDTSSIAPPEPKTKLPETVDGERIYKGEEVDKKAYIIKKPEPRYTEAARKAGIKGKVILRAILSSDARVTHIEVLSGLPMGLTESAVAAAKTIKFLPARKDGAAVSEWVKLEYNYWLSGGSYPRWPLNSR
jgi:TonB family protein